MPAGVYHLEFHSLVGCQSQQSSTPHRPPPSPTDLVLPSSTGFQLYVMLIEVFEAEKSRIRWYYMAAYGLPAVVVGISCIIDATSYGTADYCWLATDNYFILAFVGPVVLVILVSNPGDPRVLRWEPG